MTNHITHWIDGKAWTGKAAVIPTIRGSAWVTGTATWEIDPTDPFQTGYTLGDIW